MLPWILFGVTAVVSALLQWRVVSRSTQKLKLMKREHLESLVVQDDEHKKHIRRLKREYERQLKVAIFPYTQSLLPAFDALEQAVASAQGEQATVGTLLEGLEMIQDGVEKAMSENKVHKISPEAGSVFDPHQHEAIDLCESTDLPDGSIAAVIRTGWGHPERVIRPAMVRVAKRTESAEAERSESKSEENEMVVSQLEEHASETKGDNANSFEPSPDLLEGKGEGDVAGLQMQATDVAGLQMQVTDVADLQMQTTDVAGLQMQATEDRAEGEGKFEVQQAIFADHTAVTNPEAETAQQFHGESLLIDEQSEDVKVSEEVEEEPKEIVTDKVEEGEERAEEKVDSIDE